MNRVTLRIVSNIEIGYWVLDDGCKRTGGADFREWQTSNSWDRDVENVDK